jgi:hypothetical protein
MIFIFHIKELFCICVIIYRFAKLYSEPPTNVPILYMVDVVRQIYVITMIQIIQPYLILVCYYYILCRHLLNSKLKWSGNKNKR